jgi:WD40 repeat protein
MKTKLSRPLRESSRNPHCVPAVFAVVVLALALSACKPTRDMAEAKKEATADIKRDLISVHPPEYYFSQNVTFTQTPVDLQKGQHSLYWSILGGPSYYSVIRNTDKGASLLLNGNIVLGDLSGILTYDNMGGWQGHAAEQGVERVTAGWEYLDKENWIIPDWIVCDESTRHVAYAATQQGKWFNCVDGVREPLFHRVSRVTFSANGDHHAYVVEDGDKSLVVFDGIAQRAFVDVAADSVTVSDDPRCYAYIAGENKDRSFVVYGNRNGKEYLECSGLVMSSDGTKIAYRGRDADGWHVVTCEYQKTEVQGEPFQEVSAPALSKNGVHFAYYGGTADTKRLIIDGNHSEQFQGKALGKPPLITNDGKVTAVFSESDAVRLISGGKDTGVWKGLGNRVLSQNGESVAVPAKRTKESAVELLLNGDSISAHTDIISCIFTPKADHVVCGAREDDGSIRVWIEKQSGPTHSNAEGIGGMSFSPNGEMLSYSVKQEGKFYCFVNGSKSGPYVFVGVPSYANGELAFYASDGDKTYLVEATISNQSGKQL